MKRLIIALVLRGLRAPYVCVHEEQFDELTKHDAHWRRLSSALSDCERQKRAIREEFTEVEA